MIYLISVTINSIFSKLYMKIMWNVNKLTFFYIYKYIKWRFYIQISERERVRVLTCWFLIPESSNPSASDLWLMVSLRSLAFSCISLCASFFMSAAWSKNKNHLYILKSIRYTDFLKIKTKHALQLLSTKFTWGLAKYLNKEKPSTVTIFFTSKTRIILKSWKKAA